LVYNDPTLQNASPAHVKRELSSMLGFVWRS
jgi:hypothetical protein